MKSAASSHLQVFPMQYLWACLMPQLYICTAHANNSSLLQKVVLQLRVTPSMMKSTKCLIKVNAAMSYLRDLPPKHPQHSDFLGFCRCDSWLRHHTALPSLGSTNEIEYLFCTYTSGPIPGVCNPAEGCRRQRRLCQQSCVCMCKAGNRCGKQGACVFWGGTDYSVHATNIGGTAVSARGGSCHSPLWRHRANPICHPATPLLTFLFKVLLPKHPLILPALLRSRHLCYPWITDWEAKEESWRLEYSRRPGGIKGSIQLP